LTTYYTQGKGAIWRDDLKRWKTADAATANGIIAGIVRDKGEEGANAIFKAQRFVLIDEASRMKLWRKWTLRDAAAAICDKRIAAAYPQGQADLTDEQIFMLISPWATFNFELSEHDMEVARHYFDECELTATDIKELRDEVEFTALGYCGL
jgi:hypothetical protein